MIFFRPNDHFAFPDLGTTMVNLFRAATLEDWTDIMYTSWYGCDNYPMGPGGSNVTMIHGRPTKEWVCHQPSAKYGLVFIYWVIFIFVVALVMLSLFVGAITLGMQQSMDEVLEEKKANEGERRARQRKALQEKLTTGTGKEVVSLWRHVYTGGEAGTTLRESTRRLQESASGRAYMWCAQHCRQATQFAWFSVTVFSCILLASVMVTIEIEPSFDSLWSSSEYQNIARPILETTINTVFVAELIIKVAAEGPHPWRFFSDGWNIFDFFVVVLTVRTPPLTTPHPLHARPT